MDIFGEFVETRGMLRVEKLRKGFMVPAAARGEGAEGAGREETGWVVDVERFEMGAGEQVALVGSSGSGKTTFLHLLAGILAADSGVIEYLPARVGKMEEAEEGDLPVLTEKVQGVDLVKLSEAERDQFRGRHIGYIFQTHHLLPGLTAMENVLLGMSFTGRRADRGWAGHLLERVGLSHRVDYKPGKMSVGQQQRVAVARALANRPGIVLADEPTGALDAKNAQQTLELIRGLCGETGAALLLVTHDTGIAGQLGRRVELSEINGAGRG